MILFLLFLGELSLLMQMVLPSVAWLGGMRPAFLALVVIYGTLSLEGLSIFIVTTFLGLSLDLLSPNHLGISVVSLSLLAALILTQCELHLARKWYYQALLVLIGTFFYVMVDYGLYLMQIGHLLFPSWLWTATALVSVFNAVISPLAFILFNSIPRLFHWPTGLVGSRNAAFPSYARQ